MNRIQTVIVIGAIVTAVTIAGVVDWRAQHHVVSAGFWFEEVAFDMPALSEDLGGPLDEREMRTIESIAWSELRMAYAGLRISFSDTPDAFYRVRVIQEFPPRPGIASLAAAESVAMGPLGGQGLVSFEALTRLAIHYAAPDAERHTIIEGIGRGIGRVAAHEFVHQILAEVNIHDSTDAGSYEYASLDRAAQFYGPMHWDTAWPRLLQELGPPRTREEDWNR